MAVSDERVRDMRFYDREQEMAFLRETRGMAEKVARFTVVTGRRRIGKTTLIREAYKDEPFVYFFVARKADLRPLNVREFTHRLIYSEADSVLSFDNHIN
jgi:AAA+ ATPase superfamily predicted ATPase